jgi:hypothetical protein
MSFYTYPNNYSRYPGVTGGGQSTWPAYVTSYAYISAMVFDSTGNMYVTSVGSGGTLVKYSGGSYTVLYSTPNNAQPINGGMVYNSSNNTIYFAGPNNGMYFIGFLSYDLNTNTATTLVVNGSGGYADCTCLAIDSSYNVYLGNNQAGGYNNAGNGQAIREGIQLWNGSSLVSLNGGVTVNGAYDGAVYAITTDPSNNVYAGGSFTTANGGTKTPTSSKVAKWNGTTWSAVGTGSTSGTIYALAFDKNTNNLYAGGDFTQIGGVSAIRVARWDGTNWYPMGSGMNNTVRSLVFDSYGNLYAGGAFTRADGLSANGIARWNLSLNNWAAIGTGLSNSSGGTATVYTIANNPTTNQSKITLGGNFLTAGGLTTNLLADYTFVYICFKEDSKILCLVDNEEKYIPVQEMTKGTLVKTLKSGYVPVWQIGHSKIYNPKNELRYKNRLFKCTNEHYPEITEDLIITGCHSILVDDFHSEQEEKDTVDLIGDVYITEGKCRLPACVDKRALPYEVEGLHNIWHIALENESYYMNYGIYANGLLVETTSQRMLVEYSGMELV